jgi:ankyrin repeat protein
MELLLKSYDVNNEYVCSPLLKCKGFSILMFIVTNTRKYPELNVLIPKYKHIINEKNDEGWTALMIACRNSHDSSSNDTVKILLECDADVNMQEKDGWTALMLAAQNSNASSNNDTVLLLLTYGADVNKLSNKSESALALSCMFTNKQSSYETVKILLEYGADVNVKNYIGRTPLIHTCFCKDNTVQLLLTHNADVNICGDITALTAACHVNYYKGVDLLLKYGANVHAKNKKDGNALYYISSKNTNIIKLLLSYYNIDEIKKLIIRNKLVEACLDELDIRAKMERTKVKWYERVFKGIPEHDAIIRYKIGNMGHKICKFEFDGIITDELLWYLSADHNNIHQKVQQFLYDR